jgi:hypothetical protein
MRFFYAMLYSLFTAAAAAGDTKEKEMTTSADDTNNQKQIIQCPNCGESITVDALGVWLF